MKKFAAALSVMLLIGGMGIAGGWHAGLFVGTVHHPGAPHPIPGPGRQCAGHPLSPGAGLVAGRRPDEQRTDIPVCPGRDCRRLIGVEGRAGGLGIGCCLKDVQMESDFKRVASNKYQVQVCSRDIETIKQ